MEKEPADAQNSATWSAVDAVCLDQRRRWLAGERPPVEAYLELRPELGRSPDDLIELIYNEFLIREELGEGPDSQEYFRRFPSCREALRRQLELHLALQDDETWDSARATEPASASDPGTEDGGEGGAAEQGAAARASSSFFPRFPVAAAGARTLGRPAGGGASPGGEEAPEGRFEQLRRIGAGGMGVVYAAYDRRWRQAVALKTLHRQDPAALLRLKQEFRVLADQSHPNLVQLFELFVDAGRAYFTMEFIEGREFVSWCAAQRETVGGRPGPFPEAAVRQALRQLIEGLRAVHHADKLHCDLKPSNVLVSTAGRVVLLDFGMAHDLRRADPARLAAQQNAHPQNAPQPGVSPPNAPQPAEGATAAAADYLRGTIAYLAPERFRGAPASQAADWYAVGVMLYQVLAGRTPFGGDAAEMVRAKLRGEVVRPRELGADGSAELEQLCLDWLARDPLRRPTADAALARIDADGGNAPSPARREEAEPLVGRNGSLQFLHDALRTAVAEGRGRRLLVHGASGMGKTALVRKFAAELEATGRGKLLAGRCREHESIPFKAVDALLDHLAQLLLRLPADQAEALLPANTAALAELFPVLSRAPAVEAARKRQTLPVDAARRRTAAFEALGELLAALARPTPLVVWIDDVQWGDGDSARLLVYALRAAEEAPVLWLACGRSEHLAESPFLVELRAALGPGAFQEWPLPPLSPQDAAALALRQLAVRSAAEAGRSAAHRAELIARQSSGNPFLILELARAERVEPPAETPSAEASPQRRPAEDAHVDGILWARIEQTTAAAQRLLEVVSTAGGPLRLATACRAAGVDEDPQKALMELRACRLIRTWRRGDSDLAEPYHDRIREGVVRRLPAEAKQARHRGLAEAIEAEPDADPRPLARHFHAAQEPVKASRYAEAAGRAAFAASAFDEAVQFLRLASEPPSDDAARGRALDRLLADSLVGAGRGGEAGGIYERLACAAPPEEAAELRSRAVEHLLRSGRFNEGIDAFRGLVESLGLPWPASDFAVVWRFLRVRIALALRGLRFRLQPAEAVDAALLRRVDACWTAGYLLGHTDLPRCFYFMSLYTWYALRAGAAGRLARALAFEALLASAPRNRDDRKVWRLIDQAQKLAADAGEPPVVASAAMLRCGVWFYTGAWDPVVEETAPTLDFLRTRCAGAYFEIGWCYVYRLHALFCLGRWRQLRREAFACMEDARERGDVFLAAEVRSSTSNSIWLAADDPEAAERELHVALEARPKRNFLVESFVDLIARVDVDLYNRSGRVAWGRMQRAWPGLLSTNQFRVQVIHTEMAQLRARAALAALADGDGSKAVHAALAEDLKTLSRSSYPWAPAVAALHQASLDALCGRREKALQKLEEAAEGCKRHGLAMMEAAALRRKGELSGGEAGSRLVAEADARFAAEDVRRPDRMIAMLAPGFFAGGKR